MSSEEEWNGILLMIRMSPLTPAEKRTMLMNMAAKYGRELRPEDFQRAGAVI